jgi:hypothetical protein
MNLKLMVAFHSYWIMTHIDNPYPTDDEKLLLAFKGSIAIRQVNSWFGNQRGRVKKRILNQMVRSPPIPKI